MQPVVEESTAADSEAETETQAETQAERGASTAPSVLVRTRDNLREYCGSLCTTSMISCLTRWRVGRYRLSSSSSEISAKTRDGPYALELLKTSRPTSTTKDF